MNENKLFEILSQELDNARMVKYVYDIGQWHRYTGSDQGEACVDYILNNLKQAGIPVKTETYDAYVSLPVDEGTQLMLSDGQICRLIGDVYSAAAQDLPCELVYDVWSEKKKIYTLEERERFAAFKGKLVLTHASGGEFAEQLARAGAVGMIHISISKGGFIHHGNIGAEWGTPSAAKAGQIVRIPSASIAYEDGNQLIARLKKEKVTARLTINVITEIRKSRMVIADIEGKHKQFVLINGHYDSWYEGITDNAASDAMMMELAKVFWNHREHLERSVRIAWWSGHSDARYAGSTWYCDHHFLELHKWCVGNINLDLAGCKYSEQVRARTTCMEGEPFTQAVIEKYTGLKAKAYIPMIRGGDQSFWGTRIPINIMLKYEPTDEKRISPCPSGGPWWHTEQDTIDKLDEAILYRDALMNLEMACKVLNAEVLPVQMVAFAGKMKIFLDEIDADTAADFNLDEVKAALRAFVPYAAKLERAVEGTEAGSADDIIKRVAGELVRLVYTSGSPYQQDRSTAYLPFGVLRKAMGMNRENTSDVHYLFEMTEFQRACNRIAGQLYELTREIDFYLK
jgi:aminopeptidase YwaD